MSVSATAHVYATDGISWHVEGPHAWLSIDAPDGYLTIHFRNDADVSRTIAALMELRDAMRERAGLPAVNGSLARESEDRVPEVEVVQ